MRRFWMTLWLAWPIAGHAADRIRAEAEVAATKGPIKITLRLYKKKIKNSENPLYQIELKNVGKKKIANNDSNFFGAGEPEHVLTYPEKPPARCTGLCLEVIDSKGEYPWPRPPSRPEPGIKWIPVPAELQKKMDPRIEQLRKQGLTEGQINIKINDEFPRPRKEKPYMWLAPGASTTTVAWAACKSLECWDGEHMPKPIGDFTELAYLRWEPGQYRIRAIYDHSYDEVMIKKWHVKPSSEDVLVRTPFINFEVVP